MRKAAITELAELARTDRRVVLLTADLGFGVLDEFAREFPGQFVNVGVAEQAMVGVATGMAEAGLLPYCYSIATFSFLRPFEFIRNGPVAHRLPIRIIGVGAGTDYAFDGLTHYALEDLALARTQPGLTVYAPVTDEDTRALVRESYGQCGPAYFRLSRQGAAAPSHDVRSQTAETTEVLVLALGTAVERAERVAQAVAAAGASVRVLSVLRFDTTTAEDLAAHLTRSRACVTVEDHYRVGGLGAAVAEVVATRALAVPVVMDAVESLPVGALGSAQYLESKLHRPIGELVSDVLGALKLEADRT
ncbi:transketolase family protein [Actinocrinis sp.]|uniref:transketolase family protein n=1 Tax=Actinocrinis sp. TaxID=1920516 RepID=UPI002C9C6BCF|nr:transketolase C-terminal domain-containing protein [Actinocrinis sp.]HXR70931.1 transketolase C-terminal domain-containing protein [Actinocrinis sp.]